MVILLVTHAAPVLATVAICRSRRKWPCPGICFFLTFSDDPCLAVLSILGVPFLVFESVTRARSPWSKSSTVPTTVYVRNNMFIRDYTSFGCYWIRSYYMSVKKSIWLLLNLCLHFAWDDWALANHDLVLCWSNTSLVGFVRFYLGVFITAQCMNKHKRPVTLIIEVFG